MGTFRDGTPQARRTGLDRRGAVRRGRFGLLAVALLLALSGCGGSGGGHWSGTGGGSAAPPSKQPVASSEISFPADGASDVPASAEIAFTSKNADKTTVELADADGKAVQGSPRGDGTSWVPAKQLAWGTKYTATVTSTGSDGLPAVKKTTFTTMAKPANLVRISSQLADRATYGVGMPIILGFNADIPKDKRADVQKRLFLTTTPPQEGAWSWFSGHELHFRPKEYWQTGTKIDLRAAFGGVPLGGKFGGNDLTIDAAIRPDKLMMVTDNATHTMTVTKDGQVLKTIPVSLGKDSTPSSSGSMIVMVKKEQDWFDSDPSVPVGDPDYYHEIVYWTMRLTWGGQFIHSAPWSVDSQGKRNVSHGCTNISEPNGKWLYGLVMLGDPVVVKGTSRKLDWGDGWTDWNVSFEQYAKGSAIPYQPGQNGGAAPSPSTSG